MKSILLGQFNAGIDRLRIKGGAAKDALYDLVNAYIDKAGSVRARPGTVAKYTLPAGTIGLAYHDGALQTFADTVIDPGTSNVVVNVLIHPSKLGDYKDWQYPKDWPASTAFDSTATLSLIHYAQPFLGFLYVVAEFTDGFIFHYWLQTGHAWQKSTAYFPHDDVETALPVAPPSPNGYVYKPTPNNPPLNWKANTAHALNDEIIPSSDYLDNNPNASDYKFEAIEVIGDTPSSGSTEPDWNMTLNGLTYEYFEPASPDGGASSGSGGSSSGGSGASSGGGTGGGGSIPPAYRPPGPGTLLQ